MALVAAWIAAPAAWAEDKPQKLGKGTNHFAGIAVDAAGTTHVAWQSVDRHLHYSRIDARGERSDEIVDAHPFESGISSALALDSAGRPHIAYTVDRQGSIGWTQAYAHWDGLAWQIEDLGPGGLSSAIALDAEDQPHIIDVYPLNQIAYSFEYLHREDGEWVRERPAGFGGTAGSPMSLALDAAGHAHVGTTTNLRRAAYLTNASGAWVRTLLSDSFAGMTALALDSQGHPHVAFALTDLSEVHYERFDGGEWISEVAFGPANLPPEWESRPQATSLVLVDDRPHLLFFDRVDDREHGGWADFVISAHHDGVGWSVRPLTGRGRGWTRLVPEPSGAVRAAYGTFKSGGAQSGKQDVRIQRIALPELSGAWSNLAATEMNGKSRVQGVLELANEGPGKSKKTRIALFLSEDDEFDSSDTYVGRESAGPIAPEASRSVKVSFRHGGPVAGLRLIAVVDPLFDREDLDRTNNLVFGLLGP